MTDPTEFSPATLAAVATTGRPDDDVPNAPCAARIATLTSDLEGRDEYASPLLACIAALEADVAAAKAARVTVDQLAQIIRMVDGNHNCGAAELAHRILSALTLTPPANPVANAGRGLLRWSDHVEWEHNNEFELFRQHCKRAIGEADYEASTLSALTPAPVVDPVAEAGRGHSSDYIAGYARAVDDVDVMRASDGLLTGQKLIVSGLRIALTKLRAITEASHARD